MIRKIVLSLHPHVHNDLDRPGAVSPALQSALRLVASLQLVIADIGESPFELQQLKEFFTRGSEAYNRLRRHFQACRRAVLYVEYENLSSVRVDLRLYLPSQERECTQLFCVFDEKDGTPRRTSWSTNGQIAD